MRKIWNLRFSAIGTVFMATLAVALTLATFTLALAQGKASESVQDRPLGSLRDLNRAFIDISALVKPSVVTVSTEKFVTMRGYGPFALPFADDPFFNFFFGPREKYDEQPDQEYRQQGLGSGVIVSKDGHILTNNHVVAQADSIYVRTFDGQRYSATIIGSDPKTDVAVIKIKATNLEPIRIGNSDNLQVGEMVLAIGSPMSENLAYTVTQGIVSAKGRSNVGLADYEDFIQTDAAINPGNSGGPLVNLDGELVGLNTAIASRSGGFQGIGFAVPANMAISVMNSLIANGKVVRGWLGVSIQEVNDQLAEAFNLSDTRGALVGEVVDGSPADKAGLEDGDIITDLNGRSVENPAQLRSQIAAMAPGTYVNLKALRGGQEKTFRIQLGEYPSDGTLALDTDEMAERLGFVVENLTRDLAQRYGLKGNLKGTVVTSIDSRGQAYRAGLREGDVILGVDRQEVENKDRFAGLLANKKKGELVLLRVYRNQSSFYLAFPIG